MKHLWAVGFLVGCTPHLYTKGAEVSTSDFVAPENRWPVGEPAADLEGEGYEVGDIVPGLVLKDQHGDRVAQWQFADHVVLLDVSTMWCAPCQDLARTTQETWEDYRDDDFVYVTVLQADERYNPPSNDDLNRWADIFGIQAPILADRQELAADAVVPANAYPGLLIIGRDLRVKARIRTPYTDERVRAAIEAHLY